MRIVRAASTSQRELADHCIVTPCPAALLPHPLPQACTTTRPPLTTSGAPLTWDSWRSARSRAATGCRRHAALLNFTSLNKQASRWMLLAQDQMCGWTCVVNGLEVMSVGAGPLEPCFQGAASWSRLASMLSLAQLLPRPLLPTPAGASLPTRQAKLALRCGSHAGRRTIHDCGLTSQQMLPAQHAPALVLAPMMWIPVPDGSLGAPPAVSLHTTMTAFSRCNARFATSFAHIRQPFVTLTPMPRMFKRPPPFCLDSLLLFLAPCFDPTSTKPPPPHCMLTYRVVSLNSKWPPTDG